MKLIGNIEPQKAVYTNCGLPEYDENPCIAALPPIVEAEDALKSMLKVPKFKPELRTLSKGVRRKALSRIVDVNIPIRQNMMLFDRVSQTMRDAYLARNINDPAFFSWKKRVMEDFEIRTGQRKEKSAGGVAGRAYYPSSHPRSMLLTGPPGGGKTTSLESILAMYESRVIIHSDTKNGSFVQLPYIYVQCSHGGSVKGLVQEIMRQIAFLTGHEPEVLFPSYNKMNVNVLIYDLVNMLIMYSVGVIIIDEVEAIRSAASGGDISMVQFWVRLINEAYTPLILVANPDVDKKFKEQMKLLLRLSGAGALNFSYLPIESPDWSIYIKRLCSLQITKTHTPFTDALSRKIHDKSQGCLKLAGYVFMWAQDLAIEQGGDELITSAIIDQAFRENGCLVDRIIRGLANGVHVADDTDTSWLSPAKSDLENSDEDEEGSETSPSGINDITSRDPSPSAKLAPRSRKWKLVDYAEKKAKGDLTSYAALKRDGWTKSAMEFAC